MDLPRAPFHHDIAGGPEAQAYWITAEDGVRLRMATWETEGAKGTILLFPGRTEYVEKYGLAAEDYAQRGFNMVAIDWRGQGLADRLIPDRLVGHVDHFQDYQKDVTALIVAAEALDLPKPWYLMGHSMGGCIGLRALYNGLPVAAAAFSGPMWGIHLSTLMRPAAWLISGLSKALSFSTTRAPGTSGVTYVLDQGFADNALTKDADMYAYMQRQMRAVPDLALAGPSLRWLHEALVECKDLAAKPAPAYPCLTYLGADEQIVDVPAIHQRMGAWRNGTLDVVPAGEHEVLMEVSETRAHFFDTSAQFFAQHI